MYNTETIERGLTAEMVVEGLTKIVALNQNNVDNALNYLKVADIDKEQAKLKLNGLLNGDKSIIAELVSIETEDSILTATKGGVTKFKLLKQWGIPYGDRLYISHSILDNAQDIGALIIAVTAVCGPVAAPLAVGLAIGLAAAKLLDRGNGIIITQVPLAIGPCIPTPQ